MSEIRTNFRLLDASSALKDRVDHLAVRLGGRDNYGLDTPITVEQVKQHNDADDANWVRYNTKVHMAEGAAVESSTPAEGQNQTQPKDRAVKVTKALTESFERILALPAASITSTINNGYKIRTFTINVKVPLESELEGVLANLERSKT